MLAASTSASRFQHLRARLPFLLRRSCRADGSRTIVSTLEQITVKRFLSSAARMQHACVRAMPASHNCSPCKHVVSLLVVDFDETCTAKDTIGLLMSAASKARQQAGSPEAIGSRSAMLAENYAKKHSALMAQILPEGEEPAQHKPFDRAGLEVFLERLSAFDIEMNEVAVQHGAVAGMTQEQLLAAAADVQLRPSCRETLLHAQANGVPTHVISVNWSGQFVAKALGIDFHAVTSQEFQAPQQQPHPEELMPNGQPLLLANQMVVGEDGRTTGQLEQLVQCATDKGRAFQWLLHRSGVGTSSGKPRGSTVFIGDSCSDLLPLLDADVGIVLGANAMLRKVAARFGITLLPLSAAPRVSDSSEGAGTAATADYAHGRQEGVVYTASSWSEVAVYLFGLKLPPAQPNSGSPLQTQGQQQQQQQQQQPGAPMVPRVLVVAGSDSGGGAGIQADLKTIMACGAFGTTAVTALTAQNTWGVHGVHEAPIEFLHAQIDAVLGDIGTDVVKTGMLSTGAAVQAVADKVRQYGVTSLVVDPVMVSTSGHALADGSAAAALLQHLIPLASLVTPNIPEASALLGGMTIESVEDMEEAARKLQALTGCHAVLIKGGHLHRHVPLHEDVAGAEADEMVDVLFDGKQAVQICMPRISTSNTHGTGCTLASAIAAGLARGMPLLEAVQHGRRYVQDALQRSAALAIGAGMQRPFNHGFMLADWSAPAAAAVQHQQALSGNSNRAEKCLDAATVRKALRLYAVTDPHCNQQVGRTMEEAVRQAVQGGATMVQIREKDADGATFLAAARAAYKVCREAGVPLIINDRIDIALATGPDVGVHVGQGDIPAADARALLGPSRILGISVRTLDEAQAAVRDGADYLGCGAVYPTSTKDASVIGLEGLAAVCKAANPVPVVSIGGVSAANAAETIHAGAAGIAVVSAIFAAADAAEAAQGLRAVVDAALQQRGGS